MAYNRSRPIPGVSNRRVPGNGRLPKPRNVGGFRTNVPYQDSRGGDWGSAVFREYHRQQVRDVRGRFAGGWGFAWQGLAATADWLEATGWKVVGNIRENAELLKDEMVAWAKSNAPWEDRTGAARRELQGAVVWNDDTHFTIFLGHGNEIYYGIWLEVRWGGKYAIILPTLHHFAPQLGDKLVTLT